MREALELDRKNGSHRCDEAIHKEMKGLQDHKNLSVCTFWDDIHSEARSQMQGQVGDWRSSWHNFCQNCHHVHVHT